MSKQFKGKRRSLRAQYKFTVKKVAALLDAPCVAAEFEPVEINLYRQYAAGNLPLEDIAIGLNISTIGVKVLLEPLERDILLTASGLRVIGLPEGYTPPKPQDMTSEQATADELILSAGKAIGGSILTIRGLP